jgi:hypothetical protein
MLHQVFVLWRFAVVVVNTMLRLENERNRCTEPFSLQGREHRPRHPVLQRAHAEYVKLQPRVDNPTKSPRPDASSDGP